MNDHFSVLELCSEDIDAHRDGAQIEAARTRLVAAVHGGAIARARTQRRRRAIAERAALLALAAGAVFAVASAQRPHAPSPAPASAGWEAIAFSDGSSVTYRDAEFSVHAPDSHTTTIHIVRGTFQYSVAHERDTRWQIWAGPFRTDIVGTRFKLHWDPSAQSFALSLWEGSVVVRGPDGVSRRMFAGEAIRTTLRVRGEGESAAPLIARGERPQSPAEPEEPTSALPRDGASDGRPARVTVHASSREGSAATTVSRDGSSVDETLRLPLDALVDRCQSLRRERRIEQSLHCFSAVRRRFGETENAADAAFFSARMLQESGRLREATSSIRDYLRERPSGPYAEAAAGRLIECFSSMQDVRAARESSRAYLLRYPSGAHADLARARLRGVE